MYSIKFPDMFTSAKTNLIQDKEAVKLNIDLLFKSERLSLFGDPYFGTILKRLIYELNNIILLDILIDEIYTSLKVFIPLIIVIRNNIKLKINNEKIYATVRIVYREDLTSDLYEINLTSTGDLL